MTASDETYLVPPNHVEENKVWVEIDEQGRLKSIDWSIIEALTNQFDTSAPAARNEQMLIAKLMWLVREDTKKLYGGQHDS